jgi:hypothetical protein
MPTRNSGPGSSVGIETDYGLDGPGIEMWVRRGLVEENDGRSNGTIVLERVGMS